jgi:hypothetical protein
LGLNSASEAGCSADPILERQARQFIAQVGQCRVMLDQMHEIIGCPAFG